MAAIYRVLHVHVTVEVRGVYVQLTLYGEHKPGDLLIPASVTGTAKATALDMTFTGPTNKTALDRGSDRKPLAAAAIRHTRISDQGLSFTKGPLVFEITGAMGRRHRRGAS